MVRAMHRCSGRYSWRVATSTVLRAVARTYKCSSWFGITIDISGQSVASALSRRNRKRKDWWHHGCVSWLLSCDWPLTSPFRHVCEHYWKLSVNIWLSPEISVWTFTSCLHNLGRYFQTSETDQRNKENMRRVCSAESYLLNDWNRLRQVDKQIPAGQPRNDVITIGPQQLSSLTIRMSTLDWLWKRHQFSVCLFFSFLLSPPPNLSWSRSGTW